MKPHVRVANHLLLACALALCWIAQVNDATAQTQPIWQTVTIPDLPSGCQLRHVWARSRTEAYVWAQRVITNSPQSFLFRWDGQTWTQSLALTNYDSGKIFGTGASDVFISTAYYPVGFSSAGFARVFRSTDNGITWTPQTLPGAASDSELGHGYLGGTQNNVHLHVGAGHILRFDGTDWNLIFSEITRGIYGLTLVGADEGYYVTCGDWGSWDGTDWVYRGAANVGCDVYGGIWGMRDAGGLSMYAVGQNNFNNGVRVWGFNEANQTWNQVFSDGPGGAGTGNGIAVWGSASNDVYVVGELNPGQPDSGRVYRYDGTSWQQLATVGNIPRPGGIGGSAGDDIWVSLGSAGALLHYAPDTVPPSPSLSLSMYAGVTISGQTNATYQIQYSTNPSNPTGWITLTNLTLPSTPYLYFDSSSGAQPMRFYRALRIN